MDVGVNIDTRPVAVDAHNVRLNTRVEVSTLASTDSSRRPVLRNFTNQVDATIPLDKSVMLTSQDELGTDSTFQVQVVARVVK